MEQNANKLHFKCSDFNFSMCVNVYSECIYVFLIKILSLSLNDVDCWQTLLWRISGATNLLQK